MTLDAYPYEFSEALEARDAPNEREIARNITQADRTWLRNVLLPNQDARQAFKDPMTVEKILLSAYGVTLVDLVGAFLMRPSTQDCSYLYTPSFGLEHFDTQSAAIDSLFERLTIETQRDELLRFVALDIKSQIQFDSYLQLKTEPIEGAVFLDRRRSIDLHEKHNLQALGEELLKLPTLAPLLDKMLDDELGRRFANVNLAAVRMISYASGSRNDQDDDNDPKHQPAGTHSLSDALLAHYHAGAWPAAQSRAFVAPGYNAVPADVEFWEGALTKISGSLKVRLQSELESYWNDKMDNGYSRRAFFVEVMGTCWRTELIKQLQWDSIDSRTQYWLAGLHPHRPARLPRTHIKSLGYKTTKPSQAALANAFLVSDESASPGSLFIYTYGRLMAFNGQEALNNYLLQELHDIGRLDELPETLSLTELTDLLHYPTHATQLDPLAQPIFENRLEAIIAKQLENIEYVLARYSRSKGQLNLGAALEVALDVRAMINSKLPSIDTHGRWSIRLDLSAEADVQPTTQPIEPPTTTPASASASEQWHTLNTLKFRLANELAKRPDLLTFAQSSLHDEWVNAKRTDPAPANIYLNQYESASDELQALQPITSISLAEHLLERSVGLVPPLAQSTDSGLFSRNQAGSWSRIANLDMATANALVDAARVDFLPRFLHQHRTIYSRLSALIGNALDQGLRHEARQRVLAGTLDDSARELLETLLDHPDGARRKGLRGFIADAFGLTLKIAGQALPHRLFNCFLITERGGLDPLNSGLALFWTPAGGLEAFDSLHSAEAELTRRLHAPDQRLSLLENLIAAPPSADNQHNGLSIGFMPIRDNFLTDLTYSVADKALGDIVEAASAQLPAASLQGHLQSCLLRHASLAPLEKALEATQHSRLHSALPAWLANARADEQLALAELLDQHRQHIEAPLDYHHDIPDIRHFARTKIGSLLNRDFPTSGLSPDDVHLSIDSRETQSSSPQTLTDYALCHFDEIDGASATRLHANTLPDGLTVARLNALIKEADIGTHYAALLESHLSHGENRVPERQALFNPHLIWQSLEHALRQYLRQSLSAQAHSFIRHVLGMPDGIARLPLVGSDIVVRPLELLRLARASADRALGLYLIGRSDTQGPLVLFSPYGEQPAFHEYGNESLLMSELGRPGLLRQLVLGRLSSSVRQLYSEQAFSTRTVSATWNIIKGNFLNHLYNDMTALLKDQLGLQGTQGQQSAWSTVVHLLGKQLYQDARFMLGRLRMPWVIWQTLPRFKDAMDNAWQGRWAQAMEDFTGALAQLALARKAPAASALIDGPKPAQTPAPPVTPVESPLPQWPAWGDMQLTREQQNRLLGYEVRDIALSDLKHDAALGIHTDPRTHRQYAAVRGRVFQVRIEEQRWRIVTDQEPGPWLRKDTQGQWDMDLKGRLRGGGDGNCLVDPITTRQTVSREVKVLAAGMKSIRHLYPDKARQIRQGHALAVTYLRNARQRLNSLAAGTRLDSQRQLYLQEFFGLRTISRGLNKRIGRMLDKLLRELLSPARSPDLSELYVVGTSRTPEHMCAAFVVTCDRNRKIYLNELFFEPGLEVYDPIRPRTFNSVLHNMATILLHEFSHIVFNAVDIAYLDSFRPFYDLLDNTTSKGLERQLELKELQETALSSRTPSEHLFSVEDQVTETWHDIEDEPYKRVLELTRSRNLQDARRKFQDDEARRIDVILANADSVALFISYLGRPTEFYPLFSGAPRQVQGPAPASTI